MKLIKSLLAIGIFSTLSISTFAVPDYSLDTQYFNTLNSTKVISEDYINWIQFAPGNAGYSEKIHIHPTDPNTFFNSPDMGNHYVTYDQGNRFITINDFDESKQHNASPQSIGDMDFSRSNENFGLLVSGGVWQTEDKGRSWTQLRSGGAPSGRSSAVAVDPTDENIWYVGTGHFWNSKDNYISAAKPHGTKPINPVGLYKTTDRAKTWKKIITTGIPAKAEFSSIIINPYNTSEIYAATSYGLYKSIDFGNTFKKLDLDSNGQVDINDSTDLVRDIFIYKDDAKKEITIFAINQVAYFFDDTNKTIGSAGGIIKSIDGGESWINISGDLGYNVKEMYDATQSYHILNGAYWSGRFFGKYFSGSEKYPSLATGTVVNQIRANYPNLPTNLMANFNRIVVDPNDPNKIYIAHNATHTASMAVGEVWGTLDGGKTWDILTRTGYGWTEDAPYWSASGKIPEGSDLSKPNVEYHHAGEAYYYDSEYSTQGARDLDIGPDGTVYVMFRSLVHSKDYGQNWDQLDVKYRDDGSMSGTGGSNLPGSVIVTSPQDPNVMYLGTGENGIFRMVDKGEKTDPAFIEHSKTAPESPAGIAISPNDINTLYCSILRQKGKGGIFKSTDAGQNWTMISDVLVGATASSELQSPGTFVIDPNDGETMYFSVASELSLQSSGQVNPEKGHLGVWKSTDGGYNWTQKNNGMPSDSAPYKLLIDPFDSNTIYACMPISKTDQSKHNMGIGLYVSHDKAESWNLVEGLPPVIQVNDIAIDPDGNKYIATGHKGGTKTAGGVWVLPSDQQEWIKIFEMPRITVVDFDKNDPCRLLAISRLGYANDAHEINNGVYISENYGNNWMKVNQNIGNPTKIYDLEFDSQDPQIIWATSQSGGFYKGYIANPK
ncbi:MAG: hypothetical protein ATN31_06925 [Candidatus Epulonipiscioides saccharophilum]|nr:MAG: hypothetical protein ATN31_06925 [Epulopiscium sp. AS2M-Bin001]